jgi:hypothetical protein
METPSSSKVVVNFYQITQCHIPDISNFTPNTTRTSNLIYCYVSIPVIKNLSTHSADKRSYSITILPTLTSWTVQVSLHLISQWHSLLKPPSQATQSSNTWQLHPECEHWSCLQRKYCQSLFLACFSTHNA